jgi:hypothetical protein
MCSEANRPVVTFSFQIPRYGTFMMCTECFKSCVRDLSPVLGFVSLDEFSALSEKYSRELAENARYRDIFDSVGPDILALVTDRLAAAGIAVDGSDVDSPSVDTTEVSGRIEQTEPESFFLFDPVGEPAEEFFGVPQQSTKTD